MPRTTVYSHTHTPPLTTFYHFHPSHSGITEDDEIREELEQDDPGECMFTEFDSDFPLKGNGDPMNEVFKILKKCAAKKDAFGHDDEKYDALRVSKEDWIVSQEEMAAAIAVHKAQCPSIFADGMILNDNAIMSLVAMGHKMNKPYLQYVADMYQRERVANIKDSGYSIQQWKQTNLHCKELKNLKVDGRGKKASLVDDITGALSSYFHRVSPQLMYAIPYTIHIYTFSNNTIYTNTHKKVSANQCDC